MSGVSLKPLIMRPAQGHHSVLSVGDPSPAEHVQPLEIAPAARAIPQVDREAVINGPQPTARLTMAHGTGIGLGLRDAVHRECTRTLQPRRFVGALPELCRRGRCRCCREAGFEPLANEPAAQLTSPGGDLQRVERDTGPVGRPGG